MGGALNTTPEEKRRQDALPAELKDVYPMTCSECGHEQRVEPSIMMRAFGMNLGSGSCLGCGRFLHLWVEGEEIKSEPFDTYKVRMVGER
jgi:hypothetical protein